MRERESVRVREREREIENRYLTQTGFSKILVKSEFGSTMSCSLN